MLKLDRRPWRKRRLQSRRRRLRSRSRRLSLGLLQRRLLQPRCLLLHRQRRLLHWVHEMIVRCLGV